MYLPYKDGKIYYSDTGKGSVIVLLHGYLETSEVWNGFSNELSSGFRVIAADLPGHGLSDNFSEVHSMEFMASALKELLDSAGIDRVFLVGHSMGGYVTLAFLDLFPEYLSGYCLFHSHPLADSPETVEKRINDISFIMAGKKDLLIPESIKKMYADSNCVRLGSEIQRSNEIASKISSAGIISVLSGMMARPSRADLVEEGRVPLLWILGELDNYINCETIRQKVILPPNAEVVILKNSGHMGFIEEKELSVKYLTEFVSSLSF
jgi:pimeloyl-ACP methyl ester carboxylesterase